MNIALILLAVSALVGAAAGLRLKVIALVPLGLIIAVFAAAVLHLNGFGTGSGIAIVIACLILNQAAYLLVQVLGFAADSNPSLENVTDGEPSRGRKQAIENEHRYQKPAPTFLPESERSKRHLF